MKANIRIIKQSLCSKISSPDKPTITYNVGYDDKAKSLFLRITANSTGGFFSNEWINIESIWKLIETNKTNAPFKALIFKRLYQSNSANNHGFLAAALRAEKLLLPAEKQKLSHTKGDIKALTSAMQKPIKDQVSLEDEVAAAEKIKDDKREELIKTMKKTAKNK
ncbi:hypothetical protein [Amphritea sp. HPY]|uniref:hypothetical protein n=1 Tax=Amphritea sp. HPY TaxID=3421652 RepID=UPI003D7E8884